MWATLRRYRTTQKAAAGQKGFRLHFIGRVFTGGRTRRWWSAARARDRQHECLMERAGSLGSAGESLSLSLSLSLIPSFSLSLFPAVRDITRDNVTRRSNKGTGASGEPLRGARVGK